MEGLAYIVCRDSLESDTEDLKLLACGDLLHGQTKFLRLVYSVRTDDDSVGLYHLADIIGRVVVEVAVCDEDNVGIVRCAVDVVRIGVNDLSFVNVDTLDVYTHLGLEDATAELHRMEELQNARQEMDRTKEEAI